MLEAFVKRELEIVVIGRFCWLLRSCCYILWRQTMSTM